jgi:hypothetical protein
MNIALVGKFTGEMWRMESFVQRALWDLGHEVYGIRSVPFPREPNWDELDTSDEEDARGIAQLEYEEDLRVWQEQLEGITEVDLTLVIQGYTLAPWMIEDVRERTGHPVVLWHGEVLGSRWPTDDEVVQAKVDQLQQNISAYDLVCHNCATSLPVLMQLGAKKVACVPVSGVDASMHRRIPEAKKQIDVLIYGWASERRYALVKDVVDRLPQGITYAWPDPNEGYYGEPLMGLINCSRVVLNVHYSPTENIETRLYESLGCGVPCVSEPLSMPELFPEGMGVTYGNTPEALAAQIQTILGMDEATYLGFADAGYELCHQCYSYQARCAQILEVVEKELVS